MTKEVYEWDAVPGDNTFAPADGGMPELQPRSSVNNSARERMAAFRRFYNDREWIVVRVQGPANPADVGTFTRTGTNTFQIDLAGVDLTGYFGDRRFVKIIDGGGAGVDLVTQVNGAPSYSDPVTTVVVDDAIDVAASDVVVHQDSLLRGLARFDSVGAATGFFIPETADDVGLQAAIDLASAAGGGTVYLPAATYTLDAQIAIDGTKGDVTILGGLPRTEITQSAGANLDSLFFVDNAAKSVHFKNLLLNVNLTNQSGGTAYGIDVEDAISATFTDCTFTDCNTGVRLSGTGASGQVDVRGCAFDYEAYGIATNNVSNVHEGRISGCDFDGLEVTQSDPAAILVAGQWQIDGNNFVDIGSNTLTGRGVWLWNKSAATNGGRRSTVSGNTILSGSGTNGRMVEVGGDDCTVSGNVIVAPENGIGIYFNGATGGQIVTRGAASGNTISGGAQCIGLNERCMSQAISGNTLAPESSGTAIFVDGEAIHVDGNKAEGGAIGIDIGTNAQGASVHANQVDGPTTGIRTQGSSAHAIVSNTVSGNFTAVTTGVDLGGSATAAVVHANRIIATTGIVVGASLVNARIESNVFSGSVGISVTSGATATSLAYNDFRAVGTPISDSGTQTSRYHNSTDAMAVAGEGAHSSNSEVTVASGSMPGGGKAGVYLITLSGSKVYGGSNSVADFRLKIDGSTRESFSLAATSSNTHSTNVAIRTYTATSGDEAWELTIENDVASGLASAWVSIEKVRMF